MGRTQNCLTIIISMAVDYFIDVCMPLMHCPVSPTYLCRCRKRATSPGKDAADTNGKEEISLFTKLARE